MIRNTHQTKRERRLYEVYLPDNMTTEPYPVVLVHHGGGNSARGFATGTGKWNINGNGSTDDFILVFPQATELPNKPGNHTWNAGFSAKGISGADDVSYINDVLSEVCLRYNVDRTNIFACGNSNGAMFTYRLAAEVSEWFKGFGVAQGTAGGQNGLQGEPHFNFPTPEGRKLNLIAYHNEHDPSVRFLPTFNRDYPQNMVNQGDYSWYLTGRREVGFWPSVLSWLSKNRLDDTHASPTVTRGLVKINEWSDGDRTVKAIVNSDPAMLHNWPSDGAPEMLAFFLSIVNA